MSIEVVMRIYDGFANRDVPGTLAAMADDIHWYESEGLPWGGLQVGPGAVAEKVFAPSIELIPDLAVTAEETMASGDTVVVLHRYTGTVAANGRELNLLGVGVWDVSGDRIVRYRQFVDTARFNDVLAGEVAAV
jgi:uncharacterized protein